MIGEFKVDLKAYDQEMLTTIFAKEYPDKLSATYGSSSYKDGKTYQLENFCSGAFAGSKLLLICRMQADMLRCIVETTGPPDLPAMKKAINLYYRQITRILRKNGIKWREPLSTIILENHTSEGEVAGLRSRLRAIIAERWEKIVLAPIASIAASYAAIQFHILDRGEALTDVKKAVTSTIEAYIGLVVIILFVVLIQVKRREFTFNI